MVSDTQRHYDQQNQKLSQVNFETLRAPDNFKILNLTVFSITAE